MTKAEHPGGAIAFKLLQGYLWHPQSLEPPVLPATLPSGAMLVMDTVQAPFAFFEDGTWTGSQVFYQLTVLEIFPDWVENEKIATRALLASEELNPILNATDSSVGWSLSEDLRPA
ncbi:MAG: DUF3208 family protein [Deinococcales bacterium]